MEISISVTDNDKNAPPWSLESDLKGEVTVLDFKTFVRRAQWQIAEEVIKEEQDRGFDKNPRVRTDNKWGKDPREVRFMGKIEYYSRQNIGQALIDAYEIISKRSPVVSGQYIMSHYVYLNAKKIAESRGELYVWLKENEANLKDSDVIRIVNVTPYASRIEVRGGRRGTKGKNKGKNLNPMKSAIGSGVYALSARAINAKYKAQGRIRFEMIPNGYAGVLVQASSRFRVSYINDAERRRRNIRSSSGAFKRRFSGPYVYPSISFKISGEGLL